MTAGCVGIGIGIGITRRGSRYLSCMEGDYDVSPQKGWI